MNGIKALLAEKTSVLFVAGLFATGLSADAQSVQHLNITQPGGMPGMPVMNGIEKATNGISIMWDGPQGYYRVYQKRSLKDTTWQQVGNPSLARKATITTLYSNAFFRVSGPAPRYAGASVCLECHEDIHQQEMNTRHAGAFTNALFRSLGGQTNSSCLPCHTVGYGLPTGFVNATATPRLAGVQCENCHGPAANHAANETDATVRPRVEIAAAVCGGCHTGSHQPTYEEWKTSDHAVVTEDMNPSSRINSCGRCHSGSVRLSLLKNEPLPTGDANVALGCVTCHDPHQKTAYPAQLRNPLASTSDYFLTTNSVFSTAYKPGINICAQCHNHRGASWSNTSEAPHPSPQYNFLLGNIGELGTGSVSNQPAAHAGFPASAAASLSGTFYLTNQCVSCHMQDNAAPASIASHDFRVETYDVCLNCHPFDPESLVENLAKPAISNRVYRLKYALDLWASTKAPASLRTNGVLAWEYTNPGGLIWQTNSGIISWTIADEVGFKGPNAFGQTNGIPANIQRARFNLYLVLNDGSYGVHNPYLATSLLETAEYWLTLELNK